MAPLRQEVGEFDKEQRESFQIAVRLPEVLGFWIVESAGNGCWTRNHKHGWGNVISGNWCLGNFAENVLAKGGKQGA